MKLFVVISVLAVVLIAGCTTTVPLTWVCPDGTSVMGGPYNCPTESFCKGDARCFEGNVTEIIDGDTLMVDDNTIRLALVDTPEYGEEGYEEAKNFTSIYCPLGSTAIIDEDDGQNESYGRIVAVVYCSYVNLNERLVQYGYANIDDYFCNVSEFSNESWANKQWTGCTLPGRPSATLNLCMNDSQCVKEPCCYSCNSKERVEYMIENGMNECMAVVCSIDFNCTCVDGSCQASNRAY